MPEERRRMTVLIVEDDHQQRTMLALMLEKARFEVLEAAHPNEAASCWKKHQDHIALVIADIWLPGISGPELVGFFRREKPEVKSVFISGMSGDMRAEFTKLVRTSEVVRKPFAAEDLLGAIERVMGP